MNTAGLAALLGMAMPAAAQLPGPLPPTCSAADAGQLERAGTLATQRLSAGDAQGYFNTLAQAEKLLTPACRQAVLERDQPARTNCSQPERALTIGTWVQVLKAAEVGDLDRVFERVFALEDALSPACWLAVNRHEDATVRATCSAPELDHMARQTGPALRATYRMLAMNDFMTVLSVLQATRAGLSPSCAAAVDQAAWRRQYETGSGSGRRPASKVPLPQIYDLGGGSYSAPGVGACTASGCMVF